MSTTVSFTDRIRALGARGIAFRLAVVAFLGVAFGLLGDVILLPFVGWRFAEAFDGHFVHDIALTTLLVVSVVGALVQLYRPVRRVAALQLTVLAVLLATGAFALGELFLEIAPPLVAMLALALVAAALHPARGQLLRIATGRLDRVALGLVVLAAVPLGWYGVDQLGLQLSTADDHALIGHYAGMTAAALFAVVAGLVAATTTAGRRFAALAAAFVVAWVGLASAYQPAQASAVALPWAVAAVVWAVAFVAASEYGARAGSRRPAVGDVAAATH
jgi:predicted small integral membrane protein